MPPFEDVVNKCKLEIAGLRRETAGSRMIKAEQADREARVLGKDATIDQLPRELQDEKNAHNEAERQLNDAKERKPHLHANQDITHL